MKQLVSLFTHPSTVVITFTFLLIVTFANCQTHWVGGTPGSESDWNTSGNWSTGSVPGLHDQVIIASPDSNLPYIPIIDEVVEPIAHLSLLGNVELKVDHGGKLIINGSSDFNYGVFNQGRLTVFGELQILDTGKAACRCEGGRIDFGKEHIVYSYISNTEGQDNCNLLNDFSELLARVKDLEQVTDTGIANAEWNLVRKALAEYLDIQDETAENYADRMYQYANACYYTEDYSAAIEAYDAILQRLDVEKTVLYSAQFDKAMIMNQIDKNDSLILFTSIANNYDHPYHRDAKSIVERF